MFKGLGNLGALLKQAQEISSRMRGLNEELRTRRVTGTAGGDMVQVEVNGALEVVACHIDAELVVSGDREMLEDLLVTACNQAIAKARQMHADSVRALTGGLDVPSLDQALAKFLGQGPPPTESGSG